MARVVGRLALLSEGSALLDALEERHRATDARVLRASGAAAEHGPERGG